MRALNLADIRLHSSFLYHQLMLRPDEVEHIVGMALPSASLPDDNGAHQAYNTMLHRLGITERPLLLVYKDSASMARSLRLAGTPNGYATGVYHALADTVAITQEAWKSLGEGNAWGRYVMAHELGHASETPSRRTVLSGAASLLAGAITGGGILAVSQKENTAVADDVAENPVQEQNSRFAIRVLASASGALLARKLVQEILDLKEEFFADMQAIKAAGQKDVYVALSQMIVESMALKYGKKYVVELRYGLEQLEGTQPFYKAMHDIGMTHDEATDYLLAETIRPHLVQPLKPRLNLYPSHAERLSALPPLGELRRDR